MQDRLLDMKKSYSQGHVLFKQGAQSREMYILVQGSVAVWIDDQQVCTICDPGAYFGEMSTLLGVPRSATVILEQHSTFLVIPAEQVQDVLKHDPTIALKLAKTLASRLWRTNTQLKLSNKKIKKLEQAITDF